MVFNACMKFRKAAVINSDQSTPVPKTLTECVDFTLCPKEDGASYHAITCLERECNSCGLDGFALLPEEMSKEGLVRWSRYEYVSTGKFLPDGLEQKKISLVQKETSPFQLFSYFKDLLKLYPSHSFIARWQREQLHNLLEHLPIGHVVCIHDYSESKMKPKANNLMLLKFLYTFPLFILMQSRPLMVLKAHKKTPTPLKSTSSCYLMTLAKITTVSITFRSSSTSTLHKTWDAM